MASAPLRRIERKVEKLWEATSSYHIPLFSLGEIQLSELPEMTRES